MQLHFLPHVGGGRRRPTLGTALHALAAAVLLTGLDASAQTKPAPLAATAFPEGARLVSGDAVVGAPTGGKLVITQSSQTAAMEWRRFDIGKEAKVEFVQPSSDALMVNRVTSGEASRIEGWMDANGKVFLLNEQGVLIGKDARINVGGLAISTARQEAGEGWAAMTEEALKRQPRGNGEIRLVGLIRIKEGGVALLRGGDVHLGSGIRSPGGTLWVRGGKVELTSKVPGGIRIDLSASDTVAPGTIDIGAREGLVSSATLLVDAEKASGGKIRLEGASVTLNGTASANSQVRHGGTIEIDGVLGVKTTATLSAQSDPVIAQGGPDGDGGKIQIMARGGAIEADGMMVNVSGANGGSFLAQGMTLSMNEGWIHADGTRSARDALVKLIATDAKQTAPMSLMGRITLSANAKGSAGGDGSGGKIVLNSNSPGGMKLGPRVGLEAKAAPNQGRAGELEVIARSGTLVLPGAHFGKGQHEALTLGARDWIVGERPARRTDQEPDEGGGAANYLLAADLADWLGHRRSVSLIAAGRIAVKQPITTKVSEWGSLTLTAGDIALNASITRAAGDIGLLLREPSVPGVPGELVMAPDAVIEAPRSTVTFESPAPNPFQGVSGSLDGWGSGALTLGAIRAETLKILSHGVEIIGLKVADKDYDGSDEALVERWGLSRLTLLPESNLARGIEAKFEDKRAGQNKAAMARAWLTGFNGDARAELPLNQVEQNIGDGLFRTYRGWETVADIRPIPLAVHATARPKTYDGGRAAQVDLTLAQEPLPGDTVTIAHDGAEFDDPTPGAAKTITAHGVRFEGADGGNYTTSSSISIENGRIDGVAPTPRPVPQPERKAPEPEARPAPEPEPVMPAVKPAPQPEPVMPPVIPEPQPEPVTPPEKPEPLPEPIVPAVKPTPQPEAVVPPVVPEPQPEPVVSPVKPERRLQPVVPSVKPAPRPAPVVPAVKPQPERVLPSVPDEKPKVHVIAATPLRAANRGSPAVDSGCIVDHDGHRPPGRLCEARRSDGPPDQAATVVIRESRLIEDSARPPRHTR